MRATLDPPTVPSAATKAWAAPLDRPRLAGAFELACLDRATTVAPTSAGRTTSPTRTAATAGVIEFNVEAGARRAAQLLRRLDLPSTEEVSVAGLRRRYELHRISVAEPYRASYAALTTTAWRQGRAAMLSPAAIGTTAPAHVWRLRLAGAAWRGVLLAAGRHMRKHILGVRVTDQALATILVRGALLLDVNATLVRQGGSFLISVPNGPAAGQLLRGAQLCDDLMQPDRVGAAR